MKVFRPPGQPGPAGPPGQPGTPGSPGQAGPAGQLSDVPGPDVIDKLAESHEHFRDHPALPDRPASPDSTDSPAQMAPPERKENQAGFPLFLHKVAFQALSAMLVDPANPEKRAEMEAQECLDQRDRVALA